MPLHSDFFFSKSLRGPHRKRSNPQEKIRFRESIATRIDQSFIPGIARPRRRQTRNHQIASARLQISRTAESLGSPSFFVTWLAAFATRFRNMSANNRRSILAVALTIGVMTQFSGAEEITNEPAPSERFQYLVREDFFAGLKGDRNAFDRAMKLCEETLGKTPQHAQAMVWHGSGLLFLAGEAFQASDTTKGLALWQRGLKEMKDAVALQPNDLSVLIPRGATLLPVSRYDPDPAEAKELLRTGLADYEKVLQLQESYFQELAVHDKGELLSGLAEGWYRFGEVAKSRAYWQRVIRDCAGSPYAQRAREWLETKDDAMLQQKSRTLSCLGCHTGP
jgi:tetratricopeptide (TPR) repeat protein